MATFGERLKSLRSQYGYTQESLARELNVDRTSVGKWETNKNLANQDILDLLCLKFNVSLDFLLGRDSLPSNAISISEGFKAPVLGSVSAGNGVFAEENFVGYKLTNKITSESEINDYFWLKVVGDSMSPKILEGDYVLVKKQASVDSGTLAVVCVNGDEGFVKTIKYGINWIELHSFNPYYPIRRFENEECNLITVIGQVIELNREF